MVPRTMLTEWAITAFPDATHYWTFRKMVTVQLGVLGLMEYVLHLTRLYPEMLYLHQDSGLINVAYFKFNMDDTKGTVPLLDLQCSFRLCCITILLLLYLTCSVLFTSECLKRTTVKSSKALKINDN